MKTAKLSYSILNAWANNRYEDAVAMFLGKSIPLTPEIELGRLKHELWAKETYSTKALPQDFGGRKLNNPTVEQKFEMTIPFGDDMQILLRGVVDTYDTDKDKTTIYEYKCGATPSSYYVDSLQAEYYSLFLPNTSTAQYLCYNPYTKTHSVAVRYFDENTQDRTLNHIISNGGELIEYLLTQNLFIDYKETK